MSNETRERDIYLAKAMGWRYVPASASFGLHSLQSPEGHPKAVFPLIPSPTSEDEAWRRAAPHFHSLESWKAQLLRWLAADDARFEAFYNEIDARYDETDCENQFSVVSWSRFLVTLTPAQVAEAAEKAMRGMETAKPGHEHPAEQRTGEV